LPSLSLGQPRMLRSEVAHLLSGWRSAATG